MELNITSLGMLLDAPGRSFENAQFIINFLNHDIARLRLAAFNSIVSLTSSMTPAEISIIVWIVMPLFADLNPSIRLAWSKFRQNSPSILLNRVSALLPHPDDQPIISSRYVFSVR